jgi:dGTPase
MKYTSKDSARQYDIDAEKTIDEPYRSPWSKDISRIIQTAYFKNLQGKIMLMQGQKSDAFRNRMTHSHEVAQLAKSIASKINYDLKLAGEAYTIEPELCELGALASSLGRPPFGHVGEIALNRKMKDCGGFESNAQTIRILAKLAKKHYVPGTVFDTGVAKDGTDMRVGLNLTYRGLAAVFAYDKKIPEKLDYDLDNNVQLIKGFYEDEEKIVNSIKDNVAAGISAEPFQTIESQIVQTAGDIAYATYDLEEAFKHGIIKPLHLISVPDYELTLIAAKVNRNLHSAYTNKQVLEALQGIFADLFSEPFDICKAELTAKERSQLYASSLRMAVAASDTLALNGYYRVNFISKLIGYFISQVCVKEINAIAPPLSKIYLPEHVHLEIEALKCFIYVSQVNSPEVKMSRFRGMEIISQLFDKLSRDKADLLPVDVKVIFDHSRNEMARKRTVCDYIARMTDSQAAELYRCIETGAPGTMSMSDDFRL